MTQVQTGQAHTGKRQIGKRQSSKRQTGPVRTGAGGSPLVVPFVAALSLLTAGAALCTALAIAAPMGAMGDVVGLSSVSEARARSAADGAPDGGSRARRETMVSLNQSPANATAWLRLAYLESRGSLLTPQGVEYLRRSYAVSPYGPDDTVWRLRFAFNHWQALDPETRGMALRELQLHRAAEPHRFEQKLAGAGDASGRVALALMVLGPPPQIPSANSPVTR